MFIINTENTEDTEIICNRHRVYQEKPKQLSVQSL